MRIDLPFPPSVNHYWRMVNGRMIVSAAGRKYRADCQAAVLSQLGLCKPLTGRITVGILAHPPDKRRRDLDNMLKASLDALKAANVIQDDSLIDCLIIIRGAVEVDGKLYITVNGAVS